MNAEGKNRARTQIELIYVDIIIHNNLPSISRELFREGVFAHRSALRAFRSLFRYSNFQAKESRQLSILSYLSARYIGHP